MFVFIATGRYIYTWSEVDAILYNLLHTDSFQLFLI